ncbi:MAG: hypothetical protein P4L92_08365 [Rudaea sp.]|nr:hypothetical protein [Rudaea sp.]
MTAKTCAKSPIPTAMRETASDLHRLGHIDKHKTDRFDALCLTPMTYSAGQIRKLRSRLNISQNVLAREVIRADYAGSARTYAFRTRSLMAALILVVAQARCFMKTRIVLKKDCA